MQLDISARSSLTGTLYDPATGTPGSISLGNNFSTQKTIASPAGVICIQWAPTTGETLTVDLAPLLVVQSSEAFFAIDQLQTDRSVSSFDVGEADFFEIALVADPLALDAFGNPISASRISYLTVTCSGADDTVHGLADMGVAAPGDVSVFRRASYVKSDGDINQIAVTAVTATPCKLYIIFGGKAEV